MYRKLTVMKLKLKSAITAIRKKWKLYLGILIVVIIGVYFVTKSNASNTEILVFQHPTIQPISKTLDVSGHVDAKEKVRLRFIAGGKLTYIGAQEGDVVKKWQTIATIDKASLQKQLQQDLNNYMKERWDWEETQDDNKDKVLLTPQQRVADKEQWDLENTVLTVEIRDIAIQNSAIYAPFEGILTSAPTSVAGMQVLGSDYFEIVNPKSLVFRAAVDESDIASVQIGQKATLVLDAFEDKKIDTQVAFISYTSSETSSGTAFIVEFSLSEVQMEEILRIGMNGDIQILLEEKENVLTIPSIALIERDDTTYVLVKSGENQSEEREIKIGLETDELVEVLSGLSESDEIVIPE